MLPNYYLSVKFVCPGWRIPHLTLISSVEMNTEMQLYPRGKVKCFKPAMQFFHLPKSFSVISVKLSPYIFQKLKHVFVLLNNSCPHFPLPMFVSPIQNSLVMRPNFATPHFTHIQVGHCQRIKLVFSFHYEIGQIFHGKSLN